jgi:uncharacterized protein YjbI with pentapeptide repeats
VTQDTRTARERASELLRATLATRTWLPDTQAGRLVWAIRGITVLGILVLVASVVDKGLWDWLKLIGIPAVIAGVGIWFNRQQRERELGIAEQRTQDEALQAYLDQMSAMLLPNTDQPSLYKAQPGDSLSFVARARTLTVLSRLDAERKERVVQFLYESDLISRRHPVLALNGADLSGVDLSWAGLIEAYLHDVNLREANLYGVRLIGADLGPADLREADLREAGLEQADLSIADLREAEMIGAYLRGTDLRLADLREASLIEAYLEGTKLKGADLGKADLKGAIAWTVEQLRTAKSLEETTMPDGKILRGKGNPDGPTFDEWAKGR